MQKHSFDIDWQVYATCYNKHYKNTLLSLFFSLSFSVFFCLSPPFPYPCLSHSLSPPISLTHSSFSLTYHSLSYTHLLIFLTLFLSCLLSHFSFFSIISSSIIIGHWNPWLKITIIFISRYCVQKYLVCTSSYTHLLIFLTPFPSFLLKPRCNIHFQCEFTACGCVLKVFTILAQTKVITLKMQLNALNACWKHMSQRSLTFTYFFLQYYPHE